MKHLLYRRNVLASALVLMTIVIAHQVTPVAAAFGGSDTPSYSDSGEDQPSNFDTVAAHANTGECEIEVVPLYYPLSYWKGTWSAAWVGADYETTQSVTSNWYIKAQYDIDFRIAAGNLAKVTLMVVFRVYDADENLPQEKVADGWSIQGPQWSWDNYEKTYSNRQKTKWFTVDLSSDVHYKFAVGLKVYIDVAGRDIQVTARTDHTEPALLTVD
ncbi:MAG: hypothetical protein R6V83_08555 [Candidatus Thorarchaeota archaeon]